MARPANPARRQELLDEVIGYLAERGLRAMSLRALAAHLDVSTNVFSYQFGSKAQLVEAALARSRDVTRALLDSWREADSLLTMPEAMKRLWFWWRAEPHRLAFPRLNMEAMLTPTGGTLSTQRRGVLLSDWVEYFGDWLEEEGWDPEAARLAATNVLAVLSGLLLDLIATGDGERLDRSAAEYFNAMAASGPTTRRGGRAR